MNTEHKIPAPKVTYSNKASLRKPVPFGWKRFGWDAVAAIIGFAFGIGAIVYYESRGPKIEMVETPVFSMVSPDNSETELRTTTQNNAAVSETKISEQTTSREIGKTTQVAASEKNKWTPLTSADIIQVAIQDNTDQNIERNGSDVQTMPETAQRIEVESIAANLGFKFVSANTKTARLAPPEVITNAYSIEDEDEDEEDVSIRAFIAQFSRSNQIKPKTPAIIEDIKNRIVRIPDAFAYLKREAETSFRKKYKNN